MFEVTGLTPKEVGNVLGISVSTLRNWRQQRIGPPYIRLTNGRVRYPEVQFREWLDSKLVVHNEVGHE